MTYPRTDANPGFPGIPKKSRDWHPRMPTPDLPGFLKILQSPTPPPPCGILQQNNQQRPAGVLGPWDRNPWGSGKANRYTNVYSIGQRLPRARTFRTRACAWPREGCECVGNRHGIPPSQPGLQGSRAKRRGLRKSIARKCGVPHGVRGPLEIPENPGLAS